MKFGHTVHTKTLLITAVNWRMVIYQNNQLQLTLTDFNWDQRIDYARLNLKEHFPWLAGSPATPNVTNTLLVIILFYSICQFVCNDTKTQATIKNSVKLEAFFLFFCFSFLSFDYLFQFKRTRHELLQNKYRSRFFLKWYLIFISTILKLKQVLSSSSLLLGIKDRPLHNDKFFTDFYASVKL